MEQLYLIEIFIDKVTIFASDENEQSGANKSLILKIKFGPKVQFIIKEGQLAVNERKDDIIETDETGRRKWSRTIRVGKSYLFPSYPDIVLMILSKFPLELELWNDDENEVEIFVGIGTMQWDTEFFHMLKGSTNAKALHTPLSIKTITTLYAECCCKQVGEIAFILRLTALGDSIITEFQQLLENPDAFVFRTNKAPSMFQCSRVEGDDPNFCMVGSIYETTTLEDPEIIENAHKRIEVCTELQSCGVAGTNVDPTCRTGVSDENKKHYPIKKIRMGDITGPCGNTNCPLAHKVKNYIRTLDTYKKEAAGKVTATKDNVTKKICGGCICKDDRYHREECPERQNQENTICLSCGGVVDAGDTCEDKKNRFYGTGATPTGSKTQITYVFSVHHVPDFKESMFGRDFTIANMSENKKAPPNCNHETCGCSKAIQKQSTVLEASNGPDYKNNKPSQSSASTRNIGVNNPIVLNVDGNSTNPKSPTYHCADLTDDKDCKCDPPKPSPPCRTFDCDCITEIENIAARKAHKSYCPSFKHKSNCPVTMMNEEEERKEEDEDEADPLPYGLPPIKLGPCPIMGRPCTVPDGFARMYRNAVLPTLPPSYSDAGKVCCSKEYERVKKALKEYMKYEKENDNRCINRFNVDTEKRCCDKDQRLLSLMGRSCCGSHKMAIQEKYKGEKK